MSSSEQGNRQGAAPPRVTGAATSAATAAAAARAPLPPQVSSPNGAPVGLPNGSAARSTLPVSTTYGPSGRMPEAGPSAPLGDGARPESGGGPWSSPPSSTAPPTRPAPPPTRPAARPTPSPGPGGSSMYAGQPSAGGARSVRLTVAGLDPWSVLKLSFLMSVAVGIAMVVSSVVLWSVLDGMGVFDQINKVLLEITGSEGKFNIYKYVGLGRVVSLSTVLGVVNVVLMTALSTLGAFLYNLGSGLVGGLHVTLTDD